MTDVAEIATRYIVLIEGCPPSNYSAWFPDLPGCAETGETIDDTERQMRSAIELHLEGMEHDAAPIPEPSGPGVYIERTTPSAA